jgi:integrase/recombinase XerD
MTMLGAINDFYAEQEYKRNSRGMLTFYRQNFDHFLKDTGIVELSEFTEERIRRWLVGHKVLSRTTLAAYDRALRVLANWLYRRGYVETHPMQNLPKPKMKRTEIVVFTETEVRGMLAATRTQQFPKRNSSLVSLLLDTGIRAGEAAGLKLQDIHWERRGVARGWQVGGEGGSVW